MHAYGFDIQPDGARFRLVDRAEFNHWGELSPRFDTAAKAEEYARRCDELKRGKRSTVELRAWELT
ncbi:MULTISPECIES: hypothetical protein [unclassified Bradyrhizobium]|uniref:hypothetical protein n=1 Tax=Bradyrhizobium sp. USDA 4541 TaxID=2817704 RepID=UPI0020A4710F|nr:hypothetical protein [Bradyrhizobium sp. USDA 4541]MCP1852822.1 hypothetical protein [Bradyrhizobium sp. USDA 4541]